MKNKLITLLSLSLLGGAMLSTPVIVSANADANTNPIDGSATKDTGALGGESSSSSESGQTESSSSSTESTESSSTESTESTESSTESSTETSTSETTTETTSDPTQPDELPQTGDNSKLIGGIALGGSGAMLALGLALRKRS